jgi:hypothetical protein
MDKFQFERECNPQVPTMIIGKSGCGKTTYVHRLLQGYQVMDIDRRFIKGGRELLTILENTNKRNITQMFLKPEPRALLVDDIHIFLKEDIHNFKKIVECITKRQNYLRIVIVCEKKYIKNKYIKKIPCEKIDVCYTLPEMYRICSNLLSVKKIYLSDDTIDRIIHRASGNIRELIGYIDGDKSIRDTSLEYRRYGDIYIDSLNILDGCVHLIDGDKKRKLSTMYANIQAADKIETFANKRSYWEILPISQYLCNGISLYIDCNDPPVNYNRYISRSMIYIRRSKLFIEPVFPQMYGELYESIRNRDIGEFNKKLESYSSIQRQTLKDAIEFGYRVTI